MSVAAAGDESLFGGPKTSVSLNAQGTDPLGSEHSTREQKSIRPSQLTSNSNISGKKQKADRNTPSLFDELHPVRKISLDYDSVNLQINQQQNSRTASKTPSLFDEIVPLQHTPPPSSAGIQSSNTRNRPRNRSNNAESSLFNSKVVQQNSLRNARPKSRPRNQVQPNGSRFNFLQNKLNATPKPDYTFKPSRFDVSLTSSSESNEDSSSGSSTYPQTRVQGTTVRDDTLQEEIEELPVEVWDQILKVRME